MMHPAILTWLTATLSISPLYAADGDCASWRSPEDVGTIEDPSLDEISGLVVHGSGLGFWAHNDGGAPRLFAIGVDGAEIASLTVPGAEHTDWEDIAAGPCVDDPCARCLYIADIGNNSLDREGGVVYWLPEPDLIEAQEQTAPATAIPFTWPDGIFDAEAFVVHPLTGEALLITKDDPARLYRLGYDGSATASGTLDLAPLGVIDRRITGADVSPAGRQLVLRTDSDIVLFDATGQTLEGALSGAGRLLPAPLDDNAESIAFDAAGQALFTTAEAAGATLWQIQCDDFVAQGDTDTGDPSCGAEEPCGCRSEQALVFPLLLVPLIGRRRRT